MAKLKYFILVAPSFIGGALLAPGSRVTSDDLGTYTDPATGKEKPVKPGETLAEIDERGNPVSEDDALKMNAVADELAGMPIAPVQPFSPNPTKAQAAPAQPPGGVALVEKSLNTAPAEGVESDEAAAARAAHADEQAKTVGAITAESPKRRNSPTKAEGDS